MTNMDNIASCISCVTSTLSMPRLHNTGIPTEAVEENKKDDVKMHAFMFIELLEEGNILINENEILHISSN